MNYPVKITIHKDYAVNAANIQKWEIPRRYSLVLHDIPDLVSALHELQILVNEVTEAVAIENVQVQSSHTIVVSAIGELFGIKKAHRIWVDSEFRDKVLSNTRTEKKAKKMIDLEIVKHDIQTVIPMVLQGVNLKEIDQFPAIYPPIAYLYFILHKHFGDPMPKELEEAQSRVKEKEEQEAKKQNDK